MGRCPQRALPAVVGVLVAVASLALVASAGAAAARSKAKRPPVAGPRFVRTIATGETGWFSSPGLVDLTGDRRLEIVAPFYSTFVFDHKGRLLGKGTATSGRVYAPSVVADLDRDGAPEIVVGGSDGTVAAYDLGGGGLQLKPGWPASTCSGGQAVPTAGSAGAGLAAVQRQRCDVQRRRQSRLRRLRRERRDRQPRQRPA